MDVEGGHVLDSGERKLKSSLPEEKVRRVTL